MQFLMYSPLAAFFCFSIATHTIPHRNSTLSLHGRVLNPVNRLLLFFQTVHSSVRFFIARGRGKSSSSLHLLTPPPTSSQVLPEWSLGTRKRKTRWRHMMVNMLSYKWKARILQESGLVFQFSDLLFYS